MAYADPPKVGDKVWFPNDDRAAKGHEYIIGTVVEDNGDKVFVEIWDGTTFDVSKKNCRVHKERG